MAHLWIRDAGQEWMITPLEGQAWVLHSQPDQPVLRRSTADGNKHFALLLPLQARGNEESWVLMTPTPNGIRVNGERLVLGVRTLADKDEIYVPEVGHLFFSTEKLARVEPFSQAEGRRLFCPRCKQEIQHAYLAVRCPQCTVWHHQSDDLPCWSYSDYCALCDQPSALDIGYRWTPEEL